MLCSSGKPEAVGAVQTLEHCPALRAVLGSGTWRPLVFLTLSDSALAELL
jgi:hypothetical protein